MTILGTRPEIIRLSAVIQACDRDNGYQATREEIR
jgi:UDP-N-acetylglucosamine 2-epimerase